MGPRDKEMPQRGPLRDRQKQLMLAIFIRSFEAFEASYKQLTPEALQRSGDKGYALVWAVTRHHYTVFGELPTDEMLTTELEKRLEDDPEYLTESEIVELDNFVGDVFNIDEKDLAPKFAYRFLRWFLEEDLQYQLREELSREGVSECFPKLLTGFAEKAQSLTSMQAGKIAKPFDLNPKNQAPAIIRRPTNIIVLDHYLKGGQVDGEVYGFCGPWGSCKSLTAVQLAVERAKLEQVQVQYSAKNKVPLPIVYVIAYEGPFDSFKVRAVSYTAQIPRTTVEDGVQAFSTRGKLKDYEKLRYASQKNTKSPVLSEYERWALYIPKLNHNLRLVDFTGESSLYREEATDLIDGIVSVIVRDQQENDNPGVSMIVIDYVMAAVNAYITAKRLDPSRTLRLLLSGLTLDIRRRLAARFGCPVWAMQQLGTEANSRKSGVAPKTTDTPESKDFFMNVDFGFMVGKEADGGLCILTNGKHRRAEQREDTIIRINGEFCQLESTDNKYVVDSGQIVTKDERRLVADTDETVDPKGSGGTSRALGGVFDDVGVVKPKPGRR